MIILLLVVLAIALLLGIPVGFAVVMSSIITIAMEGDFSLTIVASRFVNGAASFPMLALPLFIFSGNIMAYGSTPRLMKLANMLLRRVPGGLGAVGTAGSAFYGAVSGSAVATTAAIGSIVGPEMVEQGYGKGYTASLIAGAGSLGSLIPPSLFMVLYASLADVNIGKQLISGICPGILMMICLMVLNAIIAKKRGYGTKIKKISYTLRQALKIVIDAIPPLMMPIIVLGGIMSGVITPTESAVIATIYASVLAIVIYRALSFKQLLKVTIDTVVTSAMIMIIISAAAPFGWILTTQNVAQIMANSILSISTKPIFILIAVIILVVILGTFMEGISIAILTVPILLPIIKAVGVDPIHFGTIMAVGVCIGGVTPPMAVGLYTGCSITKIRVDETFPDVLYVIGVMLISLIVVAVIPEISTFLPNVFTR